MKLQEYRIDVTTDGSGDSVDTSEDPILGRLYAIAMVDGDLADGVDTTFTYDDPAGETRTLLTLTNWNSDQLVYPRHATVDNAGAASYYNDGGDEPVEVMPIISGIVTATTAQGGDTKSGSYLLYVFE